MTTPGFEGPEKLLEIWFTPADGSAMSPRSLRRSLASLTVNGDSGVATPMGNGAMGLLRVPENTWKAMLDLVHCEVLSIIRGPDVHAYLLSESSMFVFAHKLILKTCGTTTLLHCLDRLMEIVRVDAGLSGLVDYVFYSRKSFMFPDNQPFPHNNWKTEVDCLDRHFHHGSAYVVGKINGDHWYCYLWEEQQRVLYLKETDREEAGYVEEQRMAEGPNDETLELLMCELDPVHAMRMFTRATGLAPSGRAFLTEVLQTVYPDAIIDEHMFEPCGYSCNGITPWGYFTIHVTPESHCSYASFETNIPAGPGGAQPPNYPQSFADVIAAIVGFFRPGRFTVTLFTERDRGPVSAPIEVNDGKTVTIGNAVRGFDRQSKVLYEFENYDLMFFHYTKNAPTAAKGNLAVEDHLVER